MQKKKITMENKIMKSVYSFEKKRTKRSITRYAALIIGGVLIAAYLVWQIVSTFYAQQTFDLLELFAEDYSIIKQYLWDVVFEFYLETPSEFLWPFIAVLIVLFLTIFLLIKNFKKIKNRLISLKKSS